MLGSGQGGYGYPAVQPLPPQRCGRAVRDDRPIAIQSLNPYTAAVREELLARLMMLHGRLEGEYCRAEA